MWPLAFYESLLRSLWLSPGHPPEAASRWHPQLALCGLDLAQRQRISCVPPGAVGQNQQALAPPKERGGLRRLHRANRMLSVQ
jgi:hypothetical protein